MKINGELNAYLDADLTSNMMKFIDDLAKGEVNGALDALTLSSFDFDGSSSYIKMGIARISIEIEADQNEIIRKAVAAMEAKRDELLAEARVKATAIDEKIQSLLAITYNGE